MVLDRVALTLNEEMTWLNRLLIAGLLAGLRDFEASQYEAWGAGVEEISQSKLKQPLLTRDDETLLLQCSAAVAAATVYSLCCTQ